MNTPRDAEELFDPEARRVRPEDSFLDEPPKTNDPQKLRDKALRDKSKELNQENDLKAVLATEQGVRFVARILTEACAYDADVYNPNFSLMSHIAGRRQVAKDIIDSIKNCGIQLWFRVETELEKSRPKPKTSTKRGSAP